jgi:DNA-binding FadR family transcriptional regulator
LHERIARDLAELVRDGELRPGRALPSETSLMWQYGAARSTVRQAVSWLRRHGWVRTTSGLGTRVAPEAQWPDRREQPGRERG